jgi:hypothetical protein
MNNFFKNFQFGKVAGTSAFLLTALGLAPFVIGSAFYTGLIALIQLMLVIMLSSSIRSQA